MYGTGKGQSKIADPHNWQSHTVSVKIYGISSRGRTLNTRLEENRQVPSIYQRSYYLFHQNFRMQEEDDNPMYIKTLSQPYL